MCTIAVRDDLQDAARGILQSLGSLGLKPATSSGGAEPVALDRLHVSGEFKVRGPGLAHENRGRSFLRSCLSLKIGEKLAEFAGAGDLETLVVVRCVSAPSDLSGMPCRRLSVSRLVARTAWPHLPVRLVRARRCRKETGARLAR